MKNIYILLIGCIMILGCVNSQKNEGSVNSKLETIKDTIIKNRESIGFSKLSKFSGDSFEKYKSENSLRSATVERRKGIPDDFKYIVYFDESKKCYWVEVLGGIAMVDDIYGPYSYEDFFSSR